MEENKKIKRRIRPELADKIMRLFMRDRFGFEGDPEEMNAEEEERGKAIAADFAKTHPDLTLEKAIWAIDQHLQLWEDNAIRLGKLLHAIKTHETREDYLGAIEKIGDMSEELAEAYIEAYQEDKQNG